VPCAGGRLYTVQAGDTLWELARRFQVSLETLRAANPQLTDPNALVVGQILCIPGVAPGPTCPAGTTTYTVRAGDTLFGIAQRLGTTVAELQRLNPGVDPSSLQVGRILCVPAAPAPGPTCPAGSTTYTVRAGDTFFSIAQRLGTTVAELQRLNPGVDPQALAVGQRLCVPAAPAPPPTCPAGTTTYTVRAGDTLFSIAQRYGTTVAELQRLNPGVDPTSLQVGRILCVPPLPTPIPGACPSGSEPYIVRSGDTFFAIARRLNTTVSEIERLNPGVDSQSLVVGQRLCVPRGPVTRQCPGFNYVIQSGDTFSALAARYGVTVESLREWNPFINPESIPVGAIICIPTGQR
jgi:LysM repeat protein